MRALLGYLDLIACKDNQSFHLLQLLCTQAVIGAGAAGLVATRELRREGHNVTALEQSDQAGGVWVYSEDIEAEDLLGKHILHL